MTITIPATLEAQLREKAAAAGISVEAYVEQLIREDDWAEFQKEAASEADPDFSEIRAAVTEGLEQVERGESRPAREIFDELRAKHGISR